VETVYQPISLSIFHNTYFDKAIKVIDVTISITIDPFNFFQKYLLFITVISIELLINIYIYIILYYY